MGMGLTKEQVTQVAVLLVGCLLVVLNYTLLAAVAAIVVVGVHDR